MASPHMNQFPVLQLEGFRQILSPRIPQRYLMRQIGMSWYRMMEEVFSNVPDGTRILVRRDCVWSAERNIYIIHDYMTTREAHLTFLGGPWTHQDVAYVEDEVSPYPFDMDAFHQRDDILNNYRNNMNMNPLPEGHAEMDAMDISDVPALLPLPPLSSSSLLSLSP